MTSPPLDEIGASSFPLLVGDSEAMRALYAVMHRVRNSDVAVCVRGESGTGKELVARAIHAASKRRGGPFVAINCAAIPESLQESELFGHERGAFTGAVQTHRGRFEQAEGGTLFLDELGDMSPATQVKLLRALQERMIRRVGGAVDLRTNVRIICATHRDLEAEVARGSFREDLYFRLMVFPVDVPPLRRRTGDIPALVAHFLRALRDDVGREVTRIAPDALDALRRHPWAGNVRELQNIVHRAMLSCDDDEVTFTDLALPLPSPPRSPAVNTRASAEPSASEPGRLPFLDLRALERLAIQQALHVTGMRIGPASTLLGMGRSTLYRRLIELNLMPQGANAC